MFNRRSLFKAALAAPFAFTLPKVADGKVIVSLTSIPPLDTLDAQDAITFPSAQENWSDYKVSSMIFHTPHSEKMIGPSGDVIYHVWYDFDGTSFSYLRDHDPIHQGIIITLRARTDGWEDGLWMKHAFDDDFLAEFSTKQAETNYLERLRTAFIYDYYHAKDVGMSKNDTLSYIARDPLTAMTIIS